jgi:hypothetical protein
MGSAYTPGLKVLKNTVVIKERRLPLKGRVMVETGAAVGHDTVVAGAELPGDLVTVRLTEKLGLEPFEIPQLVTVKVGDKVEKGQDVAFSKSFFGLFKTHVPSPIEGTIENFSEKTGFMGIRANPIPIELKAYLKGAVTGIFPNEGVRIRATGAFIQGIFGIGGERYGTIEVVVDDVTQPLTPDRLPSDVTGKIIVGGSLIDRRVLRIMHDKGGIGIIAGGIVNEDLSDYLGYEIGVAITGEEDIPITMIVTEGFGKMDMADRTFEILKSLAGREASINGATQIRAGATRPEVFVAGGVEGAELVKEEDASAHELKPGTRIRIIRVPYFGDLAKVTALPPELTRVESETLVRVLEAELVKTGEKVVVPRANVEILES